MSATGSHENLPLLTRKELDRLLAEHRAEPSAIDPLLRMAIEEGHDVADAIMSQSPVESWLDGDLVPVFDGLWDQVVNAACSDRLASRWADEQA